MSDKDKKALAAEAAKRVAGETCIRNQDAQLDLLRGDVAALKRALADANSRADTAENRADRMKRDHDEAFDRLIERDKYCIQYATRLDKLAAELRSLALDK